MKRVTIAALTTTIVFLAVVGMFRNGHQGVQARAEEGTENARQGPRHLNGREHGIGRQIPDLQFTDINGNTYKLSQWAKQKAVVLAMTGTGCPLCLKYSPSLASLEDHYRDRGVQFVFVNPNSSEQGKRSHDAVKEHGFDGVYVSDPDSQLCRALQAQTTTEIFVLDSARTLIYRGAVDDQYGFAYSLDSPRRTYLRDALEAVLSDSQPALTATTSPGCELFYDQPTAPSTTEVTYHNQVARIIQANCVECHRTGGIAPMPFEHYAEVKDYAGMIRNVVDRGIMPPWFADDSAATTKHQIRWANDRSLTNVEEEQLKTWVANGAPEGNPDDAPLPRTFPDGWLIGKPDDVWEFDRPVSVKATGQMPYQYVTVETELEEDKWVQAIEIRPSDPSVVHHVIVTTGSLPREEDGFWAAYVPGNGSVVYPEGYARHLPKGTRLRFQMHYTPNGKATQDATRIGVVYCDAPPEHEVRVMAIADRGLRIPARASHHPVDKTITLPFDAEILSMMAHMHVRGSAAKFEHQEKGSETSTLLNIPNYDFNWQLRYQLAEPLQLSRSDRLKFTAWYDNSPENPANPDPDTAVKWGRQTTEEMHIGYMEYAVPGLKPGESPPGTGRGRNASALVARSKRQRFAQLDSNDDGFITRDEVRQNRRLGTQVALRLFDQLDVNKDDQVDLKEFEQLKLPR